MSDIMFIEENGQFQEKNHKVSFSFFLFIIIIISLLLIGYICSNTVLMKLGYQSIDLEQKRDRLLVEKDQMEYSVECLSSLTRIERIAFQELGMHRAEKIEFIAMVPANLSRHTLASQPAEVEQGARYLEAGTFLKEFVNLQIFQNQ